MAAGFGLGGEAAIFYFILSSVRNKSNWESRTEMANHGSAPFPKEQAWSAASPAVWQPGGLGAWEPGIGTKSPGPCQK